MNTINKMYRVNALLKEELKLSGVKEIQMFPHTRYSKDVFGLWDAVGIYGDSFIGESIVWIQFKTGYTDKAVFERWCARTGSKGIIAEYIPKKVKKADGKGSYTQHHIRLTRINF